MRVIYDHQVFSNNGKSGISRYFVELASQLSKFPDVRLKIVAPISRSPLLSEQRGQCATLGVDLVGVPMATSLPDRLVRLINELLVREYARFTVPDIFHETFYATARTAPRGSRIVATVHDTIPERVPGVTSNLIRYHAERQRVLSRADWLICVSESTRSDLLELYDVDPLRVSVVRLASSLTISREGPIDIGAPYLLHVGNRFPHKNFNRIIHAFGDAKLHRTHKLVSFTNKQWSGDELNVMRSAGVPESAMVTVSGNDALLARFYAGADALAFPSLYEGFGIPLVEAMRVGCPIVTSKTSSMPEVAGNAAIYVDPKDSSAIADALMQVTSSAETRLHLIALGRAQSLKFSWEQCAAETYAVYKNLLAGDLNTSTK
ncbi:MAG TPA: glycosyltransferase family 1 protein [Terracidiphilus sp.]|nr:glycosyltransferase family 1 protein [Terracidiphilus sp.]